MLPYQPLPYFKVLYPSIVAAHHSSAERSFYLYLYRYFTSFLPLPTTLRTAIPLRCACHRCQVKSCEQTIFSCNEWLRKTKTSRWKKNQTDLKVNVCFGCLFFSDGNFCRSSKNPGFARILKKNVVRLKFHQVLFYLHFWVPRTKLSAEQVF